MTTAELANTVAGLIREGKFEEVQQRFWADDILALEPMEGPMARLQGWDAIRPKLEWWAANHEVHGCEVTGPFLHHDEFALLLTLDLTPKGEARRKIAEVVMYSTRDGRITQEKYYFGM